MNSETYDQLFQESEEARALLREMSRQIVIDQSVPTGYVEELTPAQEWLDRQQQQRKKNPNNQKQKRRKGKR